MADFWKTLTWGDLRNLFGKDVLERGKDYAKYHHVKHLWVSSDQKELAAQVIGTEEYWVIVSVDRESKTNQLAITAVTCSCPAEFFCKHATAAIIVYLDYVSAGKTPPLCEKIAEGQLELHMGNGKTKTIDISSMNQWDNDDEEDWDNSDWEDELEDNDADETPVSCRSKRCNVVTSKNSKKKKISKNEAVFRRELREYSKLKLIDYIVSIYNKYSEFRGDVDRTIRINTPFNVSDEELTNEAMRLIDEAFRAPQIFHIAITDTAILNRSLIHCTSMSTD